MSRKPIKHKKPLLEVFAIARPLPYYKMPLFDEHPVFDFVDPETGEEYKARRLTWHHYPLNQISRFFCLMCVQQEPEDLVDDMKKNYRMKIDEEVGFYMFKIVS